MRKSKSFATVCHFFIGGLKNLQRTTRSHDDEGGLKNGALSNLLGLITFLWLLLVIYSDYAERDINSWYKSNCPWQGVCLLKILKDCAFMLSFCSVTTFD